MRRCAGEGRQTQVVHQVDQAKQADDNHNDFQDVEGDRDAEKAKDPDDDVVEQDREGDPQKHVEDDHGGEFEVQLQ